MNRSVDHFSLTGKRAVVLASDTPAGRAVAQAFAEAGARLALGTVTSSASGEMSHGYADGQNASTMSFPIDLSHPESVADVVRQGAACLGGLDILACCADDFYARPLTDTTAEHLYSVMSANFAVPFCAIRAAAALMREHGAGGRVVLVTHVLGERGLPHTSAYGAAHAATQNLVRSAGRELGPAGITVNGIALGWMDWMQDRLRPDDADAERAIRFSILKRAGRPEDIGPMAVWLAGSGSGYVTGQIFHVDGGLTQHI